MNRELRAHRATITSSSTYSGHFNRSTFNSRSIRSRWGSFGRNLRVQEPSARSNLGEIPPSLSLQQLFPISSSSSLQCPDVSTYVLNCQVTSCLPVTRPRSAAALQICHFRNGAAASDASQNEGFATTRKQSGEVYTWGATVAGKVN